MTLEERVNKGIAYLNENEPDWLQHDWSDINMSSGYKCIWGVLRRKAKGHGYDAKLHEMVEETGSLDEARQWMVDHGFYRNDEYWHQLSSIWYEVIKAMKLHR